MRTTEFLASWQGGVTDDTSACCAADSFFRSCVRVLRVVDSTIAENAGVSYSKRAETKEHRRAYKRLLRQSEQSIFMNFGLRKRNTS
jgi:hypothetical protein